MGMYEWLNQTPRLEIEEALDSTESTIYELLGEYIKINNKYPKLIHDSVKAMHIYRAFELMIEAAKDHYDEMEAM